jgi:hypothetical protein
MADQLFCPKCGIQRTGRLCTDCGYDFVEGTRMPAVTLSRGVNPVSLVIGLVALAFVAFVVFIVLAPQLL